MSFIKLLSHVIFLFLILPSILSIGLPRNSLCITPNGEPAKCMGIDSCGVFHGAMNSKDPEVLQFLQMSLCGYENWEPLICCGTKSFKSNIVVPCVTPNYEKATCVPLSSCSLLQNEWNDANEESKTFLRLSQCGYSNEPHVCCGTKATFTETNKMLPFVSQCGINSGKPNIYKEITEVIRNRTGIIGGNSLDLGDFPWTALLRYKFSDGSDAGFKCGGSLINNKYVVTAGHCVMIDPMLGFDIDSIRLGEWALSTTIDCDKDICINPVIDFKIANVAVYPKYSSAEKIHDIALIKLDGVVKYSDYIRPICLPPQDYPTPEHGTKMVVTGWGTTENGSTSDIKLYVTLPIVSNDVCYKTLEGWTEITDYHMCAGGEEGKDACQGDSGGPLMGRINLLGDYQYYLDGVVSWGLECGLNQYPGIYTKVSMYTQWIIDNLEKL